MFPSNESLINQLSMRTSALGHTPRTGRCRWLSRTCWILALVLLVLVFSSCPGSLFCAASSIAGTETLIGLIGRDFILLGADSSISQSIALTASNLDKIGVIINPNANKKKKKRPQDANECDNDNDKKNRQFRQQTIVAAAAGDVADSDRLLGLLTAHASIQEYQTSVGCDVNIVTYQDESNNGRVNSLQLDHNDFWTPGGLTVKDVAFLARGTIASRLRSPTPLRVCLLIAGMMAKSPATTACYDLQNTDWKTAGNENDRSSPSFASSQVQKQIHTAASSLVVTPTLKEDTPSQDHDLPVTATSNTTRPPLLKPTLFWLDEYGSLQQLDYGAHGFGSNFILSILDQKFRPQMDRSEAIALLRECFAQLRTRYVINSPQPPCIKCIDQDGCYLIDE